MIKLSLASLVVYALLVAADLRESLKIKECSEMDYLRLPKRVQPQHYDLEIFVDPDAPAFTGEVDISVKHHENWDNGVCDKLASEGQKSSFACDRQTIVLSAFNTMRIKAVEYEQAAGGGNIPVESVCRSTKQDLIVIRLTSEPASGSEGQLKIAYQADMRDDNTGLFRADYRDVKTGDIKHIAGTHFEPSYARRAYPCFDEPDFKATFELSIIHPSHQRALSNMQIVNKEEQALVWPGKEFTKTQFGRTPKMSTYLLAFAVGEFDYIESKVDRKMTLRVYTQPGRAEEARAQLTTAVKAYKSLRDFFGVEQPISKLDFVAIRQFGGTENWGLITMEDVFLYANRDELDAKFFNFAWDTLIHEISHQWFGNLVTMKWWDDLWLKEGFAQWMGTVISDQLHPQLGAEFLWMLTRRRKAIDMDVNLAETHPIKNSALQTVDEIHANFDYITYNKGQSLFRMLDSYLGHETLKHGLRAFIKKHAYGNTQDTDLWDILQETSGVDVRDIMSTWLHQPGFPLIEVRVSEGRLKMRQSRFGAPETRQKWMVPIVLWLSDGKGRTEQMRTGLGTVSGSIELPDWFDIEKPGYWLKLNAESKGFYFTKYDRKLYAKLRTPIETKTMSPADRYNILEESFVKLMTRMMAKDEFLDLLGWYKNEDHDAVVALITNALTSLQIDYNSRSDLYVSLVSHLNRYRLKDDSIEKPNLLNQYARNAVLTKLVEGNYKPALVNAINQFAKTNGNVPGFLKEGVYKAVGLAGTDEQFKQVIEAIAKLDSPNVKIMRKSQLKHGLSRQRTQMVNAIE